MTSAKIKTLINPVKKIRKGAPRMIHNDAELEEYTHALFELTAKDKLSGDEWNTMELLELLIETYEDRGRSLPQISPVEMLRYLMDKHGLTQRDLTPEIGSDSLVSLILNGKRSLTLDHMQKLAKRFHVPVNVFLPQPTQQAA